jgi:hypothetical protein
MYSSNRRPTLERAAETPKQQGVPVRSVRISIDFGATEVLSSMYRPLAARGYGPEQLEEMKRFARRTRPDR